MVRTVQSICILTLLLIYASLGLAQSPEQAVNTEFEKQIASLPTPVQMVDPTDMQSWHGRHIGEYGNFKIVSVSDMPFEKALRIETTKFSRKSYDVQLQQNALHDAKAGDVCLLTYWGRVIESTHESGEGTVKIYFRRNKPPFGSSSGRSPRDVGLQEQWKKFYYPFELDMGRGINQAKADDLAVFVNACYNKQQTIEIADVRVLKFPDNVAFADLPESKDTYPGRELDAPWRAEAAKRIEQYRKSDLLIHVTDEQGKALPDTQVEIRMLKHGFDFGCALNAGYWEKLLKRPKNAQNFNRRFTKYFNTGSHIGMLKWPHWLKHRQTGIDSVQWMLAHGMKVRGHNLVWPRWDRTPFANDKAKQKYFAKHPDELQQVLLDHIRDLVTTFKGQIYEWDVYNEPWSHYQLAELVGMEGVVQWFKLAHEIDPNANLVLNEGGKLSKADLNEASHQAFLKLIAELRKYDAPITTVGFEAHFRWGCPSPEKILKILDYYQNTVKLPIVITEFDHAVDDEQLQADWERDFLTLCFSHPNVNGFIRWGWWNGISQGGFLNDDWSPKPNGKVFEKLVFEDWWTPQTTGKTDTAGKYNLRGFHGDYEIKITHNGKIWRYPVTLAQGNVVLDAQLTESKRQELAAIRKTKKQAQKKAISAIEQRVTQRINRQTSHAKQSDGKLEAASAGNARINLGERDGDVKLKLINADKQTQTSYATWLPKDKQQNLIVAQLPVTAGDWQTMSFTFEPQSDGKVQLALGGEYVKKGPLVWVYFEQVNVTGAQIANADFTSSEKSKPTGWKLRNKKPYHGQYVDLDGKKAMLLSFRALAYQDLMVKAKQPVTITAKVRLYQPQ